MAVSGNAHISIHAYPLLSYVAVDIYSFNIDLKTSQIMNALKVNLRSDRIKATSIRRGDFGSIRDMRPKRKSKITTARRMKNTGARIKKRVPKCSISFVIQKKYASRIGRRTNSMVADERVCLSCIWYR